MKKAFELLLNGKREALYSNLKKAFEAYQANGGQKTYSGIAAAVSKTGSYGEHLAGIGLQIVKLEVL